MQNQKPWLERYYYAEYITGYEVDFVLKEKAKVKQLIQVCYNLDDFETKKRELRALLKASKELKCRNLLVITSDYEAEEKKDLVNIKFIPLWKWLPP